MAKSFELFPARINMSAAQRSRLLRRLRAFRRYSDRLIEIAAAARARLAEID
jgi:hypothetical protein